EPIVLEPRQPQRPSGPLLAEVVGERRAGRLRDAHPGVERRRPSPLELEAEALLAAGHRPAVVRAEDRLHDEREPAEDALLRDDPPVVRGERLRPDLVERPDAAADEVARCLEAEPAG